VTDGEIKIGIDIVRNQEMALSPLANAFLSVIKKHFAFFFSRENLLASKKVEEITESYNLDLRKKYKPK
jgi:hypothetical protein